MQSQHLFWATKNYPQKDLPGKHLLIRSCGSQPKNWDCLVDWTEKENMKKTCRIHVVSGQMSKNPKPELTTFTIGVTSAEDVMIFPDVWYTLLKVPFLGGYEIC